MTGNDDYSNRASELLGTMASTMREHPLAAGRYLCAVDFYLGPVKEVALAGERESSELQALLDALYDQFQPNLIAGYVDEERGRPGGRLPFLQDRPPRDGRATAYVCEHFACLPPVHDPDSAAAAAHRRNWHQLERFLSMPDLFLELRDESGGGEQTPAPLPEDDALDLLRNAEFSASRLIPWGSNYSFAVALEAPDGRSQLAIYKPRAGEAPLYDFPEGTLYLRELAAYLFSRWAGGISFRQPSFVTVHVALVAFKSMSSQTVTAKIATTSGAAATRRSNGWCCSTTSSTTPTGRSATACGT